MNILSMSGFVPEQICDTIRFTQYPGERNISHYCGYAADFITQVMRDESIDGAVFPHTCDSSRIMKSYMSGCDKFLFQFNVPVRRDSIAVKYFADVIRQYKAAVEQHYGVTISDVEERTATVNARSAAHRALYEDLGGVSYGAYIRAVHEMLRLPLAQQKLPDTLPAKNAGNKRIFVAGSFLANHELADKLESFGMSVVGDDLPESGRLCSRSSVSTGGDIFMNISQSILGSRLSPTQNDFGDVIKRDIEEIKRKNAGGVVFVFQKYCEPYNYLYSVFKKALDSMNIPSVSVSVTDSQDAGRTELLLEAFADML